MLLSTLQVVALVTIYNLLRIWNMEELFFIRPVCPHGRGIVCCTCPQGRPSGRGHCEAVSQSVREQTGAMVGAGMNACIGLGYVSEAAELLRDMQQSGLRPDVRAYNVLLKGYANQRNVDAMQALMEDMRRLQITPSVVTVNTLIDAFVSEGRLEQVFPLVFL